MPGSASRRFGRSAHCIEETIAGAGTETGPVVLSSPPLPMWRRMLPSVAALAAGALLSGLAVWVFALRGAHSAPMHFRAVTNFAGCNRTPHFHPTAAPWFSSPIAMAITNIYISLINGGNLVKLTDDANLKSSPCWSPDGTEVAYARLIDSGVWDIWQVPALGGIPRRMILNAPIPHGPTTVVPSLTGMPLERFRFPILLAKRARVAINSQARISATALRFFSR